MTLANRPQERTGLSETEASEVRALIEQCLPVDVNIILEASEGHQFLYYQADTLVGVLGVRHDGEACLCVAPSMRRSGIGRALVAAADARLAREGIREMVVECDASSLEGQAFSSAIGGTVSHAEFRLRLADPRALRAPAGKVRLEEKLSEVGEQVGRARRRSYLARVSGNVVGGIRATFYGAETHLTGFHTVPEARRRGYGRDLLLQTCRTLIDEGRTEILLEVRTDNEAALGLYWSCGFELVRRYDSYKRRVLPSFGVEAD